MRLGIIAGAIAATLVVGCGGSAPELEDTTPPSVVSTTPAAAAPIVWITAPIVVRFSEPIQDTFTATLHAGDVPVTLAAESVELRDSGRELRITPPRTIALPAAMRLAITGVVDRFDNPLTGGDVDLRWTYPAWIRLGSGDVFDGTPCLNAWSSVVASPGSPPYATPRLGAYQPFCASRWSGSAWQLLPDPTRGAEVAVGHAAGPDGALAACACLETGPCTMRLYDGAAWRSLGSFTPATANMCRPVYRGGVLHAVVRAPGSGEHHYQMFQRVAGAWQARGNPITLTTARTIEELVDTGTGFAMLLGSNGTAYSLADGQNGWVELPSPGTGFYALGAGDGGLLAVADAVARQYSGGTWSNLGVASDVCDVFAVQGVPPVIIQYRQGGGWYVAVREWSGGAWRNLGLEQESGPVSKDLAADASGRVFLTDYFDRVYQYNR